MKITIRIAVVVLLALSMTVSEAWARGGRGGGGGGGRGGGGVGGRGGMGGMRPSPSMGRSPSMARSATPPGVGRSVGHEAGGVRPGAGVQGAGGRPVTGNRAVAGNRPYQGTARNFMDFKPSSGSAGGIGVRPGSLGPGYAGAGSAAAEFLGMGGAAGRPIAGVSPGVGIRGQNRTDLAGGRTDLRSARTGNQPQRIENRQQWQDNRVQRRDEVRNQIQDNHPRLDFWSDHPGWGAMRITRPYRWATWGAITGWVGYGWSEPMSYGYGDSIYYQGDTVYQGEQPVASAEEYTQQAEAIAASAPEAPPADAEWMPLGVFALTQDGQSTGPSPSLFLQLAISKEGIISGTLNNSATGQTQKIEGMADKTSQRCAWTVAGQTRPIMEVGISSLTQDSTPALVHFADGQTQQWLMVRLDEPAAQK